MILFHSMLARHGYVEAEATNAGIAIVAKKSTVLIRLLRTPIF